MMVSMQFAMKTMCWMSRLLQHGKTHHVDHQRLHRREFRRVQGIGVIQRQIDIFPKVQRDHISRFGEVCLCLLLRQRDRGRKIDGRT